MTKGIEQTDLAFPVRQVARHFLSVDPSRASNPEHAVHVIDSEHDLEGRPGRTLIVSKFAHNQLGTLAVDAELDAMGLADTYVLDQAEDVDIPRGRFAYIGHSEYWDHPCPWR